MDGVPHYLVDVLKPEEEFHVVRFQEMAKEALQEIYEKKQIPIIAGGTGFYIQALLYDIDFTEQDEDTALRNHYAQLAEEHGNAYLHEMLRQVDPVHWSILKRPANQFPDTTKKNGQKNLHMIFGISF